MKNKLIFAISTCLLGTLFAVSLVNNPVYQKVDAAYETRQIFSDNFDGDEFNDRWEITDNVSLKNNHSSMRFTPSQYSWSSSINYHERLEGDYKISFELQTSNMGGWFAIGLGGLNSNSAFSSMKAGVVFFDNNYSKALTDYSGSLEASGDYTISPFGIVTELRRTVELSAKYINEGHSSLQCSIYENDELIGNIFEEPLEVNNVDGFFGFNTNLKQVEIFNLSIHNGNDELVYEDDFSTSKILYSTSGTIDSEWYANSFKESDVKVGYVNSLFIEDINSGAIYKLPLNVPDNKDIDNAYTLESIILYSEMDLNVASGIEIMKKTEDLRGFFFGIERLSSGFALVIANPDGEIIHQQSTTNENINLSAKLQIKISINGDIEVSANDILYSFKIDDYEGLVGLMSYATNNSVTHGKGAYIKSFKLYRNNYYKRNAADLFLNFDGIKKTYLEDIDEYINDYYIPKKDFDIGTNVSLSKWTKKDNGNGKLEFNNATGTSFFGPKNLYKDFVVKFDVEINSLEVPYGGCVGIKFGNSINGMNIDNSKSLGIGYYPDETGTYYTVPYATNMDYTPEARHSFVDEDDQQIDFFKDQNKFTLMFVARNNTVSLHYLLEGEDEANLGIVRTSVICKENETTDGHLSVYGSYGISFSIDNLSIINLDYDSPATTYAGESNYQEVTRLDFTSSEDISGLTVDNTKFNRNRLRINEDGNISTSKLVSDNLLRLKIGSVESELEIKQGNLVIKLVNDTRPYISIVDNDLNQKYDLDSSFSFEGAVFEIERLNNRLIIRFVSGEDALSLLDNQVIEFKVSIASFDNLIITSLNGFADLEAFTFINLNKYATFVSRDYDEATDYFDPWPVKESMTGSSSGCAGSIEGTSFLLMTIALIGIITISVRRRTIRK